MALNIKNDRPSVWRQVEGESLTEDRSAPDLVETLMVISRRCSSLPDLDSRRAEEILGYKELSPGRDTPREIT